MKFGLMFFMFVLIMGFMLFLGYDTPPPTDISGPFATPQQAMVGVIQATMPLIKIMVIVSTAVLILTIIIRSMEYHKDYTDDPHIRKKTYATSEEIEAELDRIVERTYTKHKPNRFVEKLIGKSTTKPKKSSEWVIKKV